MIIIYAVRSKTKSSESHNKPIFLFFRYLYSNSPQKSFCRVTSKSDISLLFWTFFVSDSVGYLQKYRTICNFNTDEHSYEVERTNERTTNLIFLGNLMGVHSIGRWKQDASWKKLGEVKNSKLGNWGNFSGGSNPPPKYWEYVATRCVWER